jgi:ferrous iron transport protein A
MTLADLAPGDRARIEEVAGDGAVLQRILEMGLTEGEDVQVLRIAPLGDPMELRVRGYSLSLRRREAALIRVTRMEPR